MWPQERMDARKLKTRTSETANIWLQENTTRFRQNTREANLERPGHGLRAPCEQSPKEEARWTVLRKPSFASNYTHVCAQHVPCAFWPRL